MSPATPPKASFLTALTDLPKNVWKSIFRNPLPSNDL